MIYRCSTVALYACFLVLCEMMVPQGGQRHSWKELLGVGAQSENPRSFPSSSASQLGAVPENHPSAPHALLLLLQVHQSESKRNSKRKQTTASETFAQRDFSHLSPYTALCSATKKRGMNNSCKSQPSHLPLGSSPHCLYPSSSVSALPLL